MARAGEVLTLAGSLGVRIDGRDRTLDAGEFRLAKPPWAVQRALFGVLAPIGRALGRPARYPAAR